MRKDRGMREFGQEMAWGPYCQRSCRRPTCEYPGFAAILAYSFVVCAGPAALGASEAPTDEIIGIISEAQKHNRSLIPPSGEGTMATTRTDTVAGLKYEVARMKAEGESVPAGLSGEISAPLSASYSSTVIFDGTKIRWNDAKSVFAFDGNVGREYLPGNNLPRAYLEDPDKVLRGAAEFDPRRWLFGAKSSFAEWLRGKADKEQLEVRAEPVTFKGASMYDIVMEHKNGFRETLRIDPSEGCEVVQYLTATSDGRTRYQSDLSLTQTAQGGWIPTKRVSTYYGIDNQGGTSVPMEVVERTFTTLEFGPVAADEFTFAGMGVPDGTTVFDRRTPGLDFVYGIPRVTDKIIESIGEDPEMAYVLGAQDAGAAPPVEPRGPDSAAGPEGEEPTGTGLPLATGSKRLVGGVAVLIAAVGLGVLFGVYFRRRRSPARRSEGEQ
jgi:hypothetical protein